MPFWQTPLQKNLTNRSYNLIAKLNFCLIATVKLHEKQSISCQKITLRLIAQKQIQDKITL